jgi:serine/threonine protein kinase/tetratricopeptide (TPR) repeat protein
VATAHGVCRLLSPSPQRWQHFTNFSPPVCAATASGYHVFRRLGSVSPERYPTSAEGSQRDSIIEGTPMTSPDPDDPLLTVEREPTAATRAADDTRPMAGGGTQPGAADAPPAVEVPGYAFEQVLGRGGMGVVYRARHLALKRTVAIKMVLAGGHAGPHELARFRIEAEAVARLQHPNIVQIHEVGDAGGHPYFALEFVEGGTLAGRLARGPMPPREAAALVELLARAMHLAHSRNVIHRDLKPANILLTADGTPKITDFGLARQLDADSGETQAGAVMGTPSYMAPEQASGYAHLAGPAADVYALGAILYACLTGQPPFKGKTAVETLDLVRSAEPLAPSRLTAGVPLDLETIGLKCLRKQPEERYASAAELADELARFQRGVPILARPVGPIERGVRWCRRNPLVTGLIAATAVALIAGTGVSVGMAVVATERADKIESINKALGRANEEKSLAAADAIEQARIADEQSQLAYQTLESVIFDVQKKLVDVPNAQRVRGDLLQTALAGLERLSAKLRAEKRVDRSTAVATLNLAEVFRQVSGETASNTRASANQLYDRAVASFETLLAAAPDDPVAQADLAEACVLFCINLARTDDVGLNNTPEVVAAQKDRPLLARAKQLGRRAVELRRRLLAAAPDDREATYQLARALTEWSYEEMRSGDPITARDSFTESHRLLQSLLATGPHEVSHRFLFGRTASLLGDYYFDLVKGGYERAAPYYDESLAALEQLAAERPTDTLVLMEYANTWSRVADVHAERGNEKAADKAAAIAHHEKSLAAFEKELEVTKALEKVAPNNLQLMADCCISYDHVSRELMWLERYKDALPILLKAMELRTAHIAVDPTNRRQHSQMVRPTKRLGLVYDKLGRPEKAVEAYDLGLGVLTAYRTRTGDRSLDDDIKKIEAEREAVRAKVRGPK